MWFVLLGACAAGELWFQPADEPAPPQLPGGAAAIVAPPVEAEITPVDPHDDDDITMLVAGNLLSGANFRWWADGARREDLSGPTVPASEISPGEIWRGATMILSGPHAGTVAQAVATIASGDPPPAPDVALSTASPMALMDALTCEVTGPAVDEGGQAITYSVAWTRDGESVSGGLLTATLGGDTVPGGMLWDDQLWTCTGEARTAAGTATATALATVVPLDAAVVDPASWPASATPYSPTAGFPVSLRYTGALAAEPDLQFVVGFNGWALDAPDSVGRRTDENGVIFELVLDAGTTEAGERVVSTTVPDDAHALHFTVQTADGSQVDDHGGDQYHWHLDFPYIGPFLQWGDGAAQPGEGVIVSWEASTPGLGLVEYGPWPTPDRFATGEVLDTLHHVALDDLEPGTTYAYRVHDSFGARSAMYSFTTPELDADDFEFLVLADAQDGREGHRWAEVVQAASDTLADPAFVLMVGDMTADDHPGWWWRFFHGARELLHTTPIVAVIGNHDTPGTGSTPDPTSFARWFPVPPGADDIDRYALTYGNTHLLALSTEDGDTLRAGGTQHTWVGEELAALHDGPALSVDWVFASMHHPPYDAGERFAGQTSLFRAVTEQFDGVVDWTFGAHEHLGQRFHPALYDGAAAPSAAYGVGPNDGVGYVVVPPAGSRLFDGIVDEAGDTYANRALLAFPTIGAGETVVDSEHGFLTVHINGRSLSMSTWGVGTDEAPEPAMQLDVVQYSKP